MCVPVNIPDANADHRDWEYLQGSACVNIKFSLKRHFVFWEETLRPSSFVLNVLRQGYVLPLKSTPPSFHAKNNKSSLQNGQFVAEAIGELLKGGLVLEVLERPHCVNPLSVSTKGKLRLVLDLRHVNMFLVGKKFRYEDLRILAEILDVGDYFVNFDLKSGYHHVDIHPGHQKFLGFQWEFPNAVTKFYVLLGYRLD